MDRRYLAIVQISGLFLLSLLFSCNPDPSIETLLSYSLRFENKNSERFDPGQKVSVVLDAKNDLDSNDRLKVEFSVIQGGGTVSEAVVTTDSAGVAKTEWTMGSELPKNILGARLFSSKGEYIASAEMNAISFVEDKWIEVSGDPERNITGIVADTINKFTIMLAQGALYRQGDKFYKWEKIESNIPGTVRTIDMDKHGIIWVSTWNGDVLKSIDHGLTWVLCTKPYPEAPFFIYMCISNDGSLWVGRPNNTVKFSTDGGTSWQTGPSDLPTFIGGSVFRMKSGAIIVHGTTKPDKLRLHISYDDGKTWITRETPGYSTNMFVTENDEIIIGTQLNGFSFYKSTDMGLTYTRVYSVSLAWGTTMERNIFNRWKSFYYIIVPGFGILRSYDLLNYEQYTPDTSFRDLFIDHNGVLIASDKNYNRIFYLQKPLW
jgi:photosystem II stability/assembly factor-like uncharacterized protein